MFCEKTEHLIIYIAEFVSICEKNVLFPLDNIADS